MVPAGPHVTPGSGVRVTIESHLPRALPTGSATAIFCFGHCFHPRQPVVDLKLTVGGVVVEPAAARMPRRDLFEWIGATPEDPEGRSYRSGFWATLPVRAGAVPKAIELRAMVRLADATVEDAPLGSVAVAQPERYPGELPPAAADTVAICMATYDPDPELLGPQLESVRAQRDERWICLISDGGSSAERFDRLRELVGGDPRFVVWRSPERLDPYRNFERALSMVPEQVELIALCDQDDRWYADKLTVLRSQIGSAELVYSDLRLVDVEGRVLRDSLWRGRRNEWENLASVLIANTVPGATALFRRGVLELALPFPDAPGVPYHDHWLALCALARGELRYVERPLQDWVQHGAAVSRGDGSRNRSSGSRGWRAAYFAGVELRDVLAQTLLLRCEEQLPPRKRRALRWFVAAQHSPVAFLWLAARPLRRLIGRGETLGGETALARGILWRWLIELVSAGRRRPGRRLHDASFPDPPRFEQRRLRRWRSGS